MSPVAKAAMAVLPGIAGINQPNNSLTASSSRHGFAAVNFTDTNYNILPPLIGPGKVGVHILSAYDFSRPFHPQCGPGDVEIPEGLCTHPREVRLSMFYPACPGLDPAKPAGNEQYFAPVFEPSLVANISQLTLGDATAMHNVMSHAIKDALICEGEYSMVMFTPPAKGQRQAYTQFASQLASLGHIAVTVDHPYLSGFVELEDGTVRASTIGDSVSLFEAGFTQYDDIAFLGELLTNSFRRLPLRIRPADLASNFCVFGHGLGGQIAHNLVADGVAACGGHLEGLVTLPYPLNEVDAFTNEPPHIALPDPILIPLAPKRWAESLIKPTKELLAAIICRAKGTCNSATEENAIQKRSVGGDDCCHNEDWDYDDDRCDHYCDDVDFGDDGRDDLYDSGRRYEEPQHNVDDVPPLPPLDKTRPDDSPWNWDADWIDYSDNIGNYPGRRHRFPTGPRYPTGPPPRPQEPCYDDEGYLNQDCAESHGEVHDHHDDFPDYPHHGSHPSHGGVHEHYDEHPEYPHHGGHHSHPSHGGVREHHDSSHKNKGDDECGESCHGPVGHHHNDWKDVHEGYKWDDQDYDYEEDDDDDDEDKCADNDDGGADDDDECADDGDEGADDDDEGADDDDEGADDDDEGADDDDEGADDDDEGADDDDEGADDDDEGAEDDDEGAEDDAEGAEDDAEGDDEESGCEDEDPCQ
ncbi:hypothetical protein SLS53_008546 [Cytospora paraplurivora]|uniref:1-alkyl-2-acetylglycerophosphocholine esterase n=1 Tax=Cytospora paraplurivora TaxID=2898453 RepID=A0AAN9TXS8_9PEZI